MLQTTKTLFIVNNRSGWACLAAIVSSEEGRPRDDNGRFVEGLFAFEEVRVKDRRLARFSSLEVAIEAVSILVKASNPDTVFFVPATRQCEIDMLKALEDLEVSVIVRRSIPTSELEAKPRTPFAQAWLLARRAWFNDNVESQDTWFTRN